MARNDRIALIYLILTLILLGMLAWGLSGALGGTREPNPMDRLQPKTTPILKPGTHTFQNPSDTPTSGSEPLLVLQAPSPILTISEEEGLQSSPAGEELAPGLSILSKPEESVLHGDPVTSPTPVLEKKAE